MAANDAVEVPEENVKFSYWLIDKAQKTSFYNPMISINNVKRPDIKVNKFMDLIIPTSKRFLISFGPKIREGDAAKEAEKKKAEKPKETKKPAAKKTKDAKEDKDSKKDEEEEVKEEEEKEEEKMEDDTSEEELKKKEEELRNTGTITLWYDDVRGAMDCFMAMLKKPNFVPDHVRVLSQFELSASDNTQEVEATLKQLGAKESDRSLHSRTLVFKDIKADCAEEDIKLSIPDAMDIRFQDDALKAKCCIMTLPNPDRAKAVMDEKKGTKAFGGAKPVRVVFLRTLDPEKLTQKKMPERKFAGNRRDGDSPRRDGGGFKRRGSTISSSGPKRVSTGSSSYRGGGRSSYGGGGGYGGRSGMMGGGGMSGGMGGGYGDYSSMGSRRQAGAGMGAMGMQQQLQQQRQLQMMGGGGGMGMGGGYGSGMGSLLSNSGMGMRQQQQSGYGSMSSYGGGSQGTGFGGGQRSFF